MDDLAAQVIAHCRLYALTTRSALRRTLTAGDDGLARRLLRQLLRQRLLFHFLHPSGFHYYRCHPRPLSDRELLRAYAILAFSLLGDKPRPLLTAAQFAHLAELIVEATGREPPTLRPCYLAPATQERAPKLSLILVGQSTNLQRAIAHLEALVRSPDFLPWHYLAMAGDLFLTYLLPVNRTCRQELTRWLIHRPLLSVRSAHATEVPVFVSRAAPLPAIPPQKRTNPRRGSFSSHDGGNAS